MSIRIGIMGYGNLGRGVEYARQGLPGYGAGRGLYPARPESLQTVSGAPVYAAEAALSMQDKIDVMILCGGSATDLPEQTPYYARYFNVVDSFDTHAQNPRAFRRRRARRQRRRQGRADFGRLGPRHVLAQPALRRCHPPPRPELHLLGQRGQPGPFRRDPPDPRGRRRQAVHHPGAGSAGGGPQRQLP